MLLLWIIAYMVLLKSNKMGRNTDITWKYHLKNDEISLVKQFLPKEKKTVMRPITRFKTVCKLRFEKKNSRLTFEAFHSNIILSANRNSLIRKLLNRLKISFSR